MFSFYPVSDLILKGCILLTCDTEYNHAFLIPKHRVLVSGDCHFATWRQHGLKPAPGQDNGLIRRCLTEECSLPWFTCKGELQEIQLWLDDVQGVRLAKWIIFLKIKNEVTKQGSKSNYGTTATSAESCPLLWDIIDVLLITCLVWSWTIINQTL